MELVLVLVLLLHLIPTGAKEKILTSFDPDTGKVLIAYQDNGEILGNGKIIEGTVSGTSISFANKIVFDTGGL